MRIRSIKPEFWRSSDIAALPIEVRLLFIGLWSYVDDNGVGRDESALIVADLFAHDLSVSPHGTLMRVQTGLNELSNAGLIARYEVDGRPFLQIVNWDKHQKINRPSPGRYPRSDDPSAVFSEGSVSAHDSLSAGTGDQGAGDQGTGEQEESVIASDPDPPRPDVEKLLDLLDEQIEANGNRAPKRNKTNRDAMRLLLDRDEYSVEQVAWIIEWCQRDQFWQANILSASKLRQKFNTLVAQARVKSGPSQKENDNMRVLSAFAGGEL